MTSDENLVIIMMTLDNDLLYYHIDICKISNVSYLNLILTERDFLWINKMNCLKYGAVNVANVKMFLFFWDLDIYLLCILTNS